MRQRLRAVIAAHAAGAPTRQRPVAARPQAASKTGEAAYNIPSLT